MEQFDSAAHEYDRSFTYTCVGKAQRNQVWKYVDKYVTPRANHVLELNCGTGEDAHQWSNRGKHVIATDISPEMIAVGQQKFPEIDFRTLDIAALSSFQEPIDTLFSDFGGLNCLSPEQMRQFLSDAHEKLPEGGRMALVIMGKKCLWDQLYMVFKRKWKLRNRRNTNDPVEVNVDGVSVPTWYYSPYEIKAAAEGQFKRIAQRPIGLLVPPSYLSPAFESRPRLFAVVRWLDSLLSVTPMANYADHFLIVLERQ